MCINPILVPNQNKYIHSDYIQVPCGKCYSCLSSKRNQWTFRFMQELEDKPQSFFITLTYNERSVPTVEDVPRVGLRSQCFNYSDVQKYIKRVRKAAPDTKFSYYAISEYGTTTSRPHYHLALFSRCLDVPTFQKILESKWTLGNVKVDLLNQARIHYISFHQLQVDGDAKKWKELCKDNPDSLPNVMPRRFMSKGIGYSYVDKYAGYHLSAFRSYIMFNGIKIALPRYYVNKIYGFRSGLVKAQSYKDSLIYKNTRNEKIIAKFKRSSSSVNSTSIVYDNIQFDDKEKFQRMKKKPRNASDILNSQLNVNINGKY